jgi:hypothetical protein
LLPSAPIATRLDHAAVWTGSEMLIWGGRDARRSFADGAAYDPRADRWRPIAGRGASPVAAAAWTGTRMLVWDGPATAGRTTGALYNPVRDRWNPIAPGPAVGDNHSGPVWTGTQLVVWNGTETGGIAYTPATNSWSTLPPAPLARGGRWGAAMVWTGREVVIWSGWSTAAASPPCRDGPRTARPPAPERDRSRPAGHPGPARGPEISGPLALPRGAAAATVVAGGPDSPGG